MKRLIETSAGRALLELRIDGLVGMSVTVEPFTDEGEETEGKMWSSRYGYHAPDEPLPAFLKTALGIPGDEADQLAAAIEGPLTADYEQSGGRAYDETLERLTYILMAAAAGVIGLALLGVALTVWLIVR
jgi:hypothetical protein